MKYTVLKYGFCIAVILVPTSLSRADGGLTPEQVVKLRQVVAAEVSPDGRHVAYVLRVPREMTDEEDGPAWTEFHLLGPGGNSRPYITGKVNVSSVQWTPDGKAIAFLAKRNGDEQRALYIIPIDGGEARRVLSHETGIQDYSFSPDGARVAFLATEKKPENKEKLAKKGFDAEFFEEELQFVHVWIGVPDGDTDREPEKLDLPGSASEVRWAPHGDRLVVALSPTPLIDDVYMKSKYYVVDADAGEILGRVDTPGKIGAVRWSPDGNKLAIIAAADLHDPAPGRLTVVSAPGGTPRNLIPDYQGHVQSIAWQDNETIMFLGDEGVWTTLGEIAIDGTSPKTHIPAGKYVLSELSLSRDGRTAAMLGQTPRHPREVYVMRHGDAGPNRVTHNNPWLDEVRLADQEVVTYKARDGLEIQGLLIRPLDEEAGKRYPLILTVHGGPESHYRNGWLTRYVNPGQVGAARGFAVFYPNYRASTGRGVAFSKLDHEDPAGKEFDDLVDGVDHLIETGLVDREHVGVTGGSYGGFATAWCCTYYSDRFAAGVMFVGLSDLVSKVGTTDIPNEMTQVHWITPLWENWDLYRERSPIYHAESSRTPLLILGGKADRRVDPGQSLELYRHLRMRGKAPVRLVRYPGEGHGNRDTAARYDYNLRMMRWFEHYLKGPGGDPPPPELDYGVDLLEEEHDGKKADTSALGS